MLRSFRARDMASLLLISALMIAYGAQRVMAQVTPTRPISAVAALTERMLTVQNMDTPNRTSPENHARRSVKPGICNFSRNDQLSDSLSSFGAEPTSPGPVVSGRLSYVGAIKNGRKTLMQRLTIELTSRANVPIRVACS